jgi:hypothetical protein
MNLNEFDFDDEMDRDYREWKERVERIEGNVSRVGRRDLDVLARVGADRQSMVTLLALAAIEDRKWLLKLMRQRQSALKSMSRRMDLLAKEAKERINDPMSTVQFWVFMNGGNALGMQFPQTMANDPGAEFVVAGMRAMAKILGEQAKRFGLYLRAWGKTDIGVALLMARYRMFNPKMSHLEELARLLTDAFESVGKQKCFSADGLRKAYARRGKRLLAMWIRFNTPVPPHRSTRPATPHREVDLRRVISFWTNPGSNISLKCPSSNPNLLHHCHRPPLGPLLRGDAEGDQQRFTDGRILQHRGVDRVFALCSEFHTN